MIQDLGGSVVEKVNASVDCCISSQGIIIQSCNTLHHTLPIVILLIRVFEEKLFWERESPSQPSQLKQAFISEKG